MSIAETSRINEIGALGADSLSGVNFHAPSSAESRAWGGSNSVSGISAVQPGDGFQASTANRSYGNESSDFASNFAANFLGGPGADTTSRPGESSSPPDTTSTPGAPRPGRSRRSSRSRRGGRSSGARARSGRSSRSGRARNAQRRGRTGRTGRTQRAGATGRTRGNSATPPLTGNPTADAAIRMNNQHFKRGQTRRCADFVSTMLRQTGAAPRGFQHQNTVAGLARYGRSVDRGNLRPGDVVMFGNTYRRGQYTHTGIYVGNGQFVHRPTANAPVRVDNLNGGYYSSRFTGGRRMQE